MKLINGSEIKPNMIPQPKVPNLGKATALSPYSGFWNKRNPTITKHAAIAMSSLAVAVSLPKHCNMRDASIGLKFNMDITTVMGNIELANVVQNPLTIMNTALRQTISLSDPENFGPSSSAGAGAPAI